MKPSIYDYTDPVEFLKKYVEYAKTRSKLSLRGLSVKARIKSSALLPLILKGKRTLSPNVAAALARAMNLNDTEKSYFLALVEKDNPSIENLETRTLMQLRKSFIPVHYDVMAGEMGVPKEVPKDIVEKFVDTEYQIFGPAAVWGKEKTWNHKFFFDKSSQKLRCARDHGHPSKLSKEIIYYPREPLFQSYGYLYIFWEDPTPQFHALPLSPTFLSGRRTHISDSGLIVEAKFLKKKF